jgi:hypothetical protein
MIDFFAAGWWSGIGALATVAAAIGVVLAARQLSFDAWSKAQDLLVEERFKKARARVFRLIDSASPWEADDEIAAELICVRITELCRLSPYFAIIPGQGRERLIDAWDEQLAKCWKVLEPFIAAEYAKVHGSHKWDQFIGVGREAYLRLSPKQQHLLNSANQRIWSLPRFTGVPALPHHV